jgi:1-deoxy-D-xylulose-5-phosphate synthase
MKAALKLALSLDGPSAIRYPRDEAPDPLPGDCPPFERGRARVLRDGRENGKDSDGVLLCYGAMVEAGLEAADSLRAEGIALTVVNARFAKPLDEPLLTRLIGSRKPMLVIEDHAVHGGIGSAVLEMASARGLDASSVRLLGLPDRYVAHAGRGQQLAEAGLDAPSIAAAIKELLNAQCSMKNAQSMFKKAMINDQ